jgi:hypothetical protein
MGVRSAATEAVSDLVRDTLGAKDLPPDLKPLQIEVLGQLANLQLAQAKSEGRFRGAMMGVYVFVFGVGSIGSLALFFAGALGAIKLEDAYRNAVIVGWAGSFVTSGVKLVGSWLPAKK